MLVGLIVGLLQALTQIQEQTVALCRYLFGDGASAEPYSSLADDTNGRVHPQKRFRECLASFSSAFIKSPLFENQPHHESNEIR